MKIKSLLVVALTLGALAVGYSAFVYSDAYSRAIDPSALRSFSVSAEGHVFATPDIAEVTLGVITESTGKNGAEEARKENTKKMNAIIDFVKEKGVEKKDVRTARFSITPKYTYHQCKEAGPCPPPSIVGYEVSQSVIVKVRDFDMIGEIVDGASERGANSVQGPSFTIDDPLELQNKARAEAIARAKDKARATADAAGVSLGKLIAIDENFGPVPFGKVYNLAERAGFGGDEAIQAPSIIEPGQEEVQVTVSLRYEIR